jgi:hypothetical protein
MSDIPSFPHELLRRERALRLVALTGSAPAGKECRLGLVKEWRVAVLSRQ